MLSVAKTVSSNGRIISEYWIRETLKQGGCDLTF
jgi:hypothetical protein